MKIIDRTLKGLYLGASKIPNGGVGLFTIVDIKHKTPVCEYKGDVFKESEAEALLERYSYTLSFGLGHPVTLYALKYPTDGDLKWVDAHPLFCTVPLGLGSFVNDKMGVKERGSKEYWEKRMDMAGEAKVISDPKYQKFLTEIGYNLTHEISPYKTQFTFTALRDIKAGEELYIDYGDHYWKPFFKKTNDETKSEQS